MSQSCLGEFLCRDSLWLCEIDQLLINVMIMHNWDIYGIQDLSGFRLIGYVIKGSSPLSWRSTETQWWGGTPMAHLGTKTTALGPLDLSQGTLSPRDWGTPHNRKQWRWLPRHLIDQGGPLPRVMGLLWFNVAGG